MGSGRRSPEARLRLEWFHENGYGSFLTLDRAGLAVFDDVGGERAAAGIAPLHGFHDAQIRGPALAREVDAHVTAVTALAKEDVGVVGEIPVHPLLRPGLRSDRGANEFGCDHVRGRIVEVELELRNVEAVHVAADDHRVGDVFRLERVEKALARGGVTVPAVGPGAPAGSWLLIELRHGGGLPDDVPARARITEAVLEPAFLPAPEHGAARCTDARAGLHVDGVGAAAAAWARAGVPRAVLATVEHMEARERTPVDVGIDLHARALRLHARWKRHVLVVGAVRGFAPQQERFAVHAVFGAVVCVIVVHLVVVPGEDPRAGSMRLLQVGIAAIERVARAVSLERIGLRGTMAAHVVAAPARLVDIVAEEYDEVRLVGHDVAGRPREALLVLLAESECDPHAAADLAGRRRRTRAPDAASRIARREAVPVPAFRLEPVDLDVYRMEPLRLSERLARAHHRLEAFIGGDLPFQRHRHRVHAGQPRPQHDARWRRIARGDAERERVGLSTQVPADREGAEGLQEAAAGKHASRIPASGTEPAMIHFVVHEEGDGVGVVVVEGVKAGQELSGWIMEDDKDIRVTARNDIPIGHKLALRDYREGDTVIKYGVDIGKVVQPIRKGEHLHVHNVKTKRW